MHAPQRVIRHPVPVELIDSIFELFEDGHAALATQAAAYEHGLAQGMDTRVLVRVLYLTTLTRRPLQARPH